MISGAPLRRLMEERNLSVKFVSQITGMSENKIKLILTGNSITPENINTLCSILNCQPCDIIEWTDTEKKGHWVWVEEKK